MATAEDHPLTLQQKVFCRLVFLLEQFNQEIDDILHYLVERQVFRFNGAAFQEIMAQRIDRDKFRKLLECLPKRDKFFKFLLQAIEATDTFKKDSEWYLLQFATERRGDPRTVLTPQDWRPDPNEDPSATEQPVLAPTQVTNPDGEYQPMVCRDNARPHQARVQDESNAHETHASFAVLESDLLGTLVAEVASPMSDTASFSSIQTPVQPSQDPYNLQLIGGPSPDMRAAHPTEPAQRRTPAQRHTSTSSTPSQQPAGSGHSDLLILGAAAAVFVAVVWSLLRRRGS